MGVQSHESGNRCNDQAIPDVPLSKVIRVSADAPQANIASLILNSSLGALSDERLLLEVSSVLPHVSHYCPDKADDLAGVNLV